uniref:Uncharacterized protein n=1 Tax=Arundo donax TaxID=35708 RepID=A0A0A9ED66_ARUDO
MQPANNRARGFEQTMAAAKYRENYVSQTTLPFNLVECDLAKAQVLHQSQLASSASLCPSPLLVLLPGPALKAHQFVLVGW